jgi:hypothetical protein
MRQMRHVKLGGQQQRTEVIAMDKVSFCIGFGHLVDFFPQSDEIFPGIFGGW